ncbi:hypothetical protein VYU27_002407 [Nannochloropsis oceanica]
MNIDNSDSLPSPRTPNRPTSKGNPFLSPSSSFMGDSSSFSMLCGSPSSSFLTRQWSNGTPPGSPSTSKLHYEYQSRIKSPVKRRMSLEQQMANDASSPKRTHSPLALSRSLSDGLVYGDRFIPARNAPQMEIAYSLMNEEIDNAGSNHASSPFRGPAGVISTRPSTDSFSASPSVSVAASSSVLASSSSSLSLFPDLPLTGGASATGSTATAATTSPPDSRSTSPSALSGAGDVGPERQPILNMLLRSELLGVDLHHPYSRPSSSAFSGGKHHLNDDRAGGGGLPSGAADGRGSDSSSSSINGIDGTGSSSSIGRPAGGEGGPGSLQRSSSSSSSSSPNLLQFKPARECHSEEVHRSFSLLPMGPAQRRLLSTPFKAKRKVSKVPFKVLDAPALQDDFYLNLVDWSSLNVLAVGLGTCVYLWSACTSSVTKLCDLGEDDSVTSVAWTQRGTHLAVGTNTGEVQMWDVGRCQRIRSLSGHSARIGTMSWNGQVLASGSRDRLIYLRDVRAREPRVKKLQGHRQEVCGLRWSFDDCQLASGGNDNKLYIWTLHSSQPVQKFTEHTAAVKALAWSPHQGGLLASGGGTADRHIRFWNTLTGASLSRVDTGSQVCNLMWSKNVNEIVSTHGYSLNQIILWRYPSMTKVTTLTGHTFRVLYLAISPDGQTIVTGAGDETLRFWNVFPGAKSRGGEGSRLGTNFLFPVGHDIR